MSVPNCAIPGYPRYRIDGQGAIYDTVTRSHVAVRDGVAIMQPAGGVAGPVSVSVAVGIQRSSYDHATGRTEAVFGTTVSLTPVASERPAPRPLTLEGEPRPSFDLRKKGEGEKKQAPAQPEGFFSGVGLGALDAVGDVIGGIVEGIADGIGSALD